MTPPNHKTAFANVALGLLCLAYAYWTLSRRAEAFGIGTTHASTNTTGCYQFGKVLSLVEFDHGSGSFRPFTQELRVHGFDIYWDSLEPTLLTFAVVNHQQSGSGVSIFRHRIGTKVLWHVKTVKSPLLYAPNDVVATSHNTFYATNDMRSTNSIMRKIEIFFGMPWGHIVHYNHAGVFSVAASGISYPNGIARSADGSSVYVAASSEPSVIVFRPAVDGTLEPMGKTVFRDFIPDNVSVDTATGQVLVAGFLNTFEMFRYNREVLGGTSARPAGAVRRLRPLADPRKGFAEESVLTHDGALLPATTSATLQRRSGTQRILLGSVMANHIAICRVGDSARA
ncbi:hypothetical protein LPJ61_001085 [Coemansia biformis]|uniref:Calcium-dependent phosphotriesterase n=1 Tax=Coemansia biformis TaxID=1286918 RepID=A0A9W7YH42_9FUNG|nr:hypothetical protein LPJ61_001085 [Coemansia biformis]